MHKPNSKSPLSKIPKSSSASKSPTPTDHRQSSPIGSKRLVGQPKGEIDNVTPMPTIQEESELDEPTESNRPDGKATTKTLAEARLDAKSDRRLVDNRNFSKFKAKKEEPDRKWPDKSTMAKGINDKKSSSVPSLGSKPRESKLINLSKLKSAESSEQASRYHVSTLSSMSKHSPLNRPKQFVKQPLAVKKESGPAGSLLSGRGTKENLPNALNLERVKDKIESQNVKDSLTESGTNKSAKNESSAKVSSLLFSQQVQNELRNRFESESIKGNQINQDNLNQAEYERREHERHEHERHEQHICRICLDSIQVDGDDLIADHDSNSALNSVPTSTDRFIDELDDDKNAPPRKQTNYISPCDCKGQSKYVHRKCLSEWIYVSKKTSCQVCLVKFRNIKIKVFKKSVMKWLTDEYDHLLMLILYLIPFLIDCLLIFNFLTCDIKVNHPTPAKSQLINPSAPAVGVSSAAPTDESQLDGELAERLERLKTTQSYESNYVTSAQSAAKTVDTGQSANEETSQKTKSSAWSVFPSFISFKRTKNLSKSMSMSMFIYNLYFLELKIFVKNCSICLSGIPVTFLISLPSLLLFVRYCRSRYEEWQTENLEVSIDS